MARQGESTRRGDSPGVLRVPWATLGIIVVTTAVFLLELLHPSGIAGAREQWGMTPALAWGGGVLPQTAVPAWAGVFTATFIHDSWTHLAANMLILLVLGWGVELRLGGWRFAALYLLAGWLATLAEALVHARSTGAAIGASMAVAGVWAGWLVASRGGVRPALGAAVGGRWGRLAGEPVRAVEWLTAIAAFIGWFGYPLLAAFTGAGLRVFWSRSFTAHLLGAIAGLLLVVVLLLVRAERHAGRRSPAV